MTEYEEFIAGIKDSARPVLFLKKKYETGFVLINLRHQFYLVDVVKAEKHRKDLVNWMESYSWDKGCFVNRGFNFFQIGLGDMDTTFRYFAMGAVIGLWNLITPEFIGLSGEEADKAVADGFIAINVYDPNGTPGVLSGIAQRNEQDRREKSGEFVLTNSGNAFGQCFCSPKSGICKQQHPGMPAIYCWAYSEESARRIVDMVGRGAKYFYDPFDPKRTHTVVITACREEEHKLNYLNDLIKFCGYITREMVELSRNFSL